MKSFDKRQLSYYIDTSREVPNASLSLRSWFPGTNPIRKSRETSARGSSNLATLWVSPGANWCSQQDSPTIKERSIFRSILRRSKSTPKMRSRRNSPSVQSEESNSALIRFTRGTSPGYHSDRVFTKMNRTQNTRILGYSTILWRVIWILSKIQQKFDKIKTIISLDPRWGWT